MSDTGRLHLVREAHADLRARPAHAAELVSQAIMGEILHEVRRRGEWIEAGNERAGRGWIRAWALCPLSRAAAERWRRAPLRRVVAPYLPLLAAPSLRAGRLAEAGFLARFPSLGRRGAYERVRLPDRRAAWIPRAGTEAWPPPAPPPPPERLLRIGRRLLGTPYVWGGASGRSYDCSGLVMRLYEWAGLSLPRDSDEQAALGYDFRDAASAGPGDLLFFGRRGRAVSHVVIAMGRGRILHAAPSSVRIERLASRPDLARTFRGGRRYPDGVAT